MQANADSRLSCRSKGYHNSYHTKKVTIRWLTMRLPFFTVKISCSNSAQRQHFGNLHNYDTKAWLMDNFHIEKSDHTIKISIILKIINIIILKMPPIFHVLSHKTVEMNKHLPSVFGTRTVALYKCIRSKMREIALLCVHTYCTSLQKCNVKFTARKKRGNYYSFS